MENTSIGEEFVAQRKSFCNRVRELGLGDVSRFYWYHTLDLGEGLVTPGMYDYRLTLDAFHFPANMDGMCVLDVGSATGFFAFEFEKRGAQVVSVELPSLELLDRFPGQTTPLVLQKLNKMLEPLSNTGLTENSPPHTAEQLYFYLVDGPFRFCQKRLHSAVSRCYSTVYDLSVQRLGTASFDWVFLGDILVHTLNPLRALAAVAPLCKDTLVISQVMPEALDGQPAMLYVGGENPEEDDSSWWWPNKLCFEQVLKKLGFRTVREVGRNQGVMQPTGHPFDRPILHAKK